MFIRKRIPKLFFPIFCLFLLTLACSTSSSPPTEVSFSDSPELTPASSPGLSLPKGDQIRLLRFAGQGRSYLLHVPPNFNSSQPTPLVLVFHGISLNAQEMVRISGFSALADSENFLVAYPEGFGVHQSWNGGQCCGEAMKKKVDDVGFTRAIIEDVATLVNLDRARVFATGFSNGAIMTYRLACDLADQIAAIGPVAAAPATESCNPSRSVPVIHFHGDADALNPYDGGKTDAGTEFMSVETGLNLWNELNGCPDQALETTTGNIVHRIYAPCQENAVVELYIILGGEHAWPGGEAVNARVGEPTDEINATELIWAFFMAHPMP